MDIGANLSQYSTEKAQLLFSLGQQYGQREAILSIVDAAITRLHKDYQFVGYDKPYIIRSFFVRQVKNLGSCDFRERLTSVATIALCCISVVGVIFILVAIPIHLHYFAMEKKLHSLINDKKSLEAALEKRALFLKKEPPQPTASQALQLPPQQHVGFSGGERKVSGSTALAQVASLAGKGSDLPSFQQFYNAIKSKIALALPSQESRYFNTRPRDDGSDAVEFIINSIIQRAIKEDSASHKIIIQNPLMCYRFEKKLNFPDGVILHVYHDQGEGRAPSLHIWYPDNADRQNLTKYSILRIDLVAKRRAEVKGVTLADIQELYRYMNTPIQV